MAIIDDFTPTTASINTCHGLALYDEENDIVVGSSCTHIFKFPFKYSEVVESIQIIYRQGIYLPTIIKDENDVTVEELKTNCGKDYSVVTLVLTPEETSLFKGSLLDTFVQVKIVNKDGETLYNSPTELVVRVPLDR